MNIDNKSSTMVGIDPQNVFHSEAVVNFKFVAGKALTTREAVDALR